MKLVTICYVDNGNQFLLLHRNKKENDLHEGKWVGVGGKLDPGESPEECARREIFEETGLIAKKMRLCGHIVFPSQSFGEDFYAFVFRVTEFEGSLLEDCREGTLEWVDYNKIIEKPTWSGDYQFIQWILENRAYFSAKFVYDQEVLIETNVEFYGGDMYANF